MKLGIIGGGVLGLTLALRRVQAGDDVIIFEKGREAGGLAASFPVSERPDSPYLEKFYHHIFQTDKDIIRLIDELGLTEQLEWKIKPTSTFRGGKIYRMDSALGDVKNPALQKLVRPLIGNPLDTALAIMRFKPVSFIGRLRFGLAGAYMKFESKYQRLEKFTAAGWARKWMGKPAYEAILKPLLTSKFGEKYEQISMSWLWSRFHERTAALGYMKGGFHKLYVKLYEAVLAKGGEVRFEANVSNIKATEEGKVIIEADGQDFVFDKVVVTTPTRIFTQLAKDSLPKDYVERYTGPNSVEHYSAQCLILSLDRKLMSTYWLNMNDPGFPFLALVEHTSFMPPSDYDGQNLLYLGNYLPPDHPLLTKSKEEVLEEFLPYLKRVNPKFDPSWIVKSWVWRAPFAQPIVTVGYKDKLPPHQTPIKNVLLANMAHVYPQDRGQNYSVKLGEKIAKML